LEGAFRLLAAQRNLVEHNATALGRKLETSLSQPDPPGTRHEVVGVLALAVVGIDIGGTRIKAALVGDDGRVLRDQVRPTPPELRDRFADTMAEIVTALDATGCAIGIVVPGLVDDARGIGVWSANLNWENLPIRDIVATALAVPVAVGHDVRAGLLGEHRYGAARGHGDVLFLALGTGLAAAAMSGGQVISGSPWSGEIGHVCAVPEGRTCGCGRRGCLETVASAGGIAAEYAERRAATQPLAETVDAAGVAARMAAGDDVAKSVWNDAINHLAAAIAPVILTLGTRRIVIGGGLIGAGETLLEPLRSGLSSLLPQGTGVEIVAAELGDRAAALGASVLAESPL